MYGNRSSSIPAMPDVPILHRHVRIRASAELPIHHTADAYTIDGDAAVSHLPTMPAGTRLRFKFNGNPTFTNSSKLVVASGADVTFSPGDMADAWSTGDGWLLSPLGMRGMTTVAPLGGNKDDTANLIKVANACSSAGIAMMLQSGQYNIKQWVFPQNPLALICSPGTIINSTLTADGSPASAGFYASPPGVSASTTVSSPNTVGTLTVSVAASVAVGKYVRILDTVSSSGFHGNSYLVRSVSGSGPYTLTLDRPVLTQFGSGDAVDVLDNVPHGHRVYGRGAELIGTGTRLFEWICTHNCKVVDFRFIPTAIPDITASFDLCGFDNHFIDCEVDGNGSGAFDGLALETQERSSTRANVHHLGGRGIAFFDCEHCTDESHSYENAFGIVINADGAANTTGCNATYVGGVYDSNTTQGIAVIEGSRNTRINAIARYNPTNVSIGGGNGSVDGTVIEGVFTNATTGIFIDASATNTAIGQVDTANCTTPINNAGPIAIGKSKVQSVSTGNAVSLTSGNVANILSLSLSAGEYEVTANTGFVFAGTTTSVGYLWASVGTVSGGKNVIGGQFALQQFGSGTAIANINAEISTLPSINFTLTLVATTTIYLTVEAGFSGGTLSGFGYLRVRRTA